ncbi:TrkH family potassium uptake protein [Pseudoroseicyclus tamaricis]|uniref:TrkH family potassium uptake protein n=1 Tax=Pseudoroseicyclus tamaricis TaxID=2705421 RepID=A0A6B2JYC9_9RHOB|nr:TrkH family potassium uptake protein [Pseudoroseicyclus tamaricis]NDV01304.1 TrkH family potassium uptake protein [Pseudoroseicyclus tamaricis]
MEGVAERRGGAPFFVYAMATGAIAMLVPAFHALTLEDFETARIFFYGFILFGMLTALIGVATRGARPSAAPQGQLAGLLAAFLLLPVMLAVPFFVALGEDSFLEAWFEMVAAFTTTGGTVYDNVGRLNPSLHLWRALVGWLGGLTVWVTAAAILAPMNLGGYEVQAAAGVDGGAGRLSRFARHSLPAERLARQAAALAPVYAGLTGALWVGLLIAGEVPLVAICHAMSVMATSGISPLTSGTTFTGSGFFGELLMALFMIFAISRHAFARRPVIERSRSLVHDPEVAMAMSLVIIVPGLLFLRHFVAASGDGLHTGGILAGIGALWGSIFTVLSFLTTTGFESAEWRLAQDWSGLHTPGLVLVGLALVGGGVATTAGGVKLLRIYALYKHGVRELARLVHPSSVGGSGHTARRIRREGAYISWLFFMLFALSLTTVMLLLSLYGVQFETAMILAVAALSNCGPIVQIAGEYPISFEGLRPEAKTILAFTMVLGRLETLALIALLNPAAWRR